MINVIDDSDHMTFWMGSGLHPSNINQSLVVTVHSLVLFCHV